MIFVTVGGQMGFDRLVLAVDEWAARRARTDVFAQIGPGSATPRHMRWTRWLDPPQFRQAVANCRVLVAHAGMGSILTALTLGKPILVMPRRGELGETRNDHQLATARELSQRGSVAVALDAAELHDRLDQLERIAAGDPIPPQASDELLAAVRAAIDTAPRRGR